MVMLLLSQHACFESVKFCDLHPCFAYHSSNQSANFEKNEVFASLVTAALPKL